MANAQFPMTGASNPVLAAMTPSKPAYGHEGNRSLIDQVQLKDIQKRLPLRVLAVEDWRHWTTWGHVIIPNAVPPDHLERLRSLLWEFQEMDPRDPSSWNKRQLRTNAMQELNNSGMMEIYNHQYFSESAVNSLTSD
jgi:hypothetical protein